MKTLINKNAEKTFLDYYGYDDGRNIKMKDMVGMFSALNRLDPEVATQAIKQFPELAKTTVVLAKQFCEVSLDSLKKHQETTKDTLQFLKERAIFIENLINKEQISDENRHYLVEKLMELSKMALKIHEDSQNFFLNFLSKNGKYLGGFLFLTVVTLGVNGNLKMPEFVKSSK